MAVREHGTNSLHGILTSRPEINTVSRDHIHCFALKEGGGRNKSVHRSSLALSQGHKAGRASSQVALSALRRCCVAVRERGTNYLHGILTSRPEINTVSHDLVRCFALEEVGGRKKCVHRWPCHRAARAKSQADPRMLRGSLVQSGRDLTGLITRVCFLNTHQLRHIFH